VLEDVDFTFQTDPKLAIGANCLQVCSAISFVSVTTVETRHKMNHNLNVGNGTAPRPYCSGMAMSMGMAGFGGNKDMMGACVWQLQGDHMTDPGD
jgi:hypothetical protein